MSSPRPEGSHEGVLGSYDGLSPSQEARSKTQWSLESRERLTSSPKPAKSYEGVLGSHEGLSPSQGSKEEDSAETGEPGKTHAES